MEIRTIGIDLGKTVFHFVGINARGEVVVRKKNSRSQPRFPWHEFTEVCRHVEAGQRIGDRSESGPTAPPL